MNKLVPNKKIYAIVICYNAAPVLAELYKRIDKELYDKIYFFDDNSPDGSADIAKQFDWIVIKNEKNLGYGSTAKVSTVLNYCKIKNETIEYFLDTTPNKVGKYMPGSHIYIKKYKKPLTNEADYVFLGAWNFKKEIFNKERKFIKKGGKFITHVPVPKII